MKSFLKTYKEYSKEYEEFDLKKLKSITTEKYLMESDSQQTLSKKWRQWRQIWMISYGVLRIHSHKLKFQAKRKWKSKKDQSRQGNNQRCMRKIIKKWKACWIINDLSHFCIELTTRDVRLLKFEDIKMKISKLLLLYIDQRIIVDNKYYHKITLQKNN